MALAISITQSIESDLSIIQLRNREKLQLAYRNMQLKWPDDASIVVDEYGYVVDINSHANTLLGSSSSILNQAVNICLPKLANVINECINNDIEKECEIELMHPFSENAHFLLKPIKVSGERLGCIILIANGKSTHDNITSLRSNEDELIKKTLIQTNGNVSKAARILNINRATIYRRRKN